MKASLTLILVFYILPIFAQQNCELCDAVAVNDFKKVEKLIVAEIKKREDGTLMNNDSLFTSYEAELDEMVEWLLKKNCVKNAERDKWGAKMTVYPRRSTIGVQFKQGYEIIEKCYHLTEGRLKGRRSIDQLTFVGSSNCSGFIEDLYKVRRLSVDLVPHKGESLIGYWMDSTKRVGIYISPATEFDKEQLVLHSISNTGEHKGEWYKDSIEIIMSSLAASEDTLGNFNFSFCTGNNTWCYYFIILDLKKDEMILETTSIAGKSNSNLNPKPITKTIFLERNNYFK